MGLFRPVILSQWAHLDHGSSVISSYNVRISLGVGTKDSRSAAIRGRYCQVLVYHNMQGPLVPFTSSERLTIITLANEPTSSCELYVLLDIRS